MSRRNVDHRSGALARASSLLVALATGVLGLGAGARAQGVSPAQAPAAWVRYAEDATQSLVGWLEAEDEVATRFRSHLDTTRPADDQPTPPLVLKVWVNPDGAVSQVAVATLPDEQVSADLRAVIVGRRLPPPPKDILLPLRLSIQLEPAEPTSTGSDGPALTRQAARRSF